MIIEHFSKVVMFLMFIINVFHNFFSAPLKSFENILCLLGRLALEYVWIKRLQCVIPAGLNHMKTFERNKDTY